MDTVKLINLHRDSPQALVTAKREVVVDETELLGIRIIPKGMSRTSSHRTCTQGQIVVIIHCSLIITTSPEAKVAQQGTDGDEEFL